MCNTTANQLVRTIHQSNEPVAGSFVSTNCEFVTPGTSGASPRNVDPWGTARSTLHNAKETNDIVLPAVPGVEVAPAADGGP